jgi:RNA polymerase sigma-70 factor (ECF subfamily)
MTTPTSGKRFERLLLPHLDAAYSLSRWLMRNGEQADDAVQEAYLRALRFFGSFRGDQGRPWLLRIVRNVCYEMLDRERAMAGIELDEQAVDPEAVAAGAVVAFPVSPEAALIERATRSLVHRCLRALPADYREVVVLRELHECSYREIAAIVGVPIGTVMSRLSRGRRLLQARIAACLLEQDTGT